MFDRWRSIGVRVVAAGAALLLLATGPAARAADGGPVVVLTASGTVDGAMAGFLAAGVEQATADGASAVVVKLDTFGGSLEATAQITTTLLEARVPVIVWVAPAGGRAASAGTFITLAGNLAYMAPGTNIGAASPVSSTGGDIPGTMGEKVRNDAIAKIAAIAGARGRPVAWAISTVAEARSYPAADAVAVGAVDGIAATLDEVLAAASGRVVQVAGVPRTLDLSASTATEIGMNPLQAFLHLVSDPNVAFVLFLLGVVGIALEFVTTNFLTGILGAIAIVLSFVGFGNLPLNVAGLVLVTIGVALILLETQVPSHGLLTAGAAACIALGAGVLYAAPDGPTMPDVQVAGPVIVSVVGFVAIFGALISVVAMRTRHMLSSPRLFGSLEVVGEPGKVARPLDPVGTVVAMGEAWSARSSSGMPLGRGARVRVVRRDGLTLYVEPAPDASMPGTVGIDSMPTQPAP